jgi:ribosome-associated protein
VGIEGAGTSTWLVLDASDVIIHLFYPETRDYYQLDKIYEAKENLSL